MQTQTKELPNRAWPVPDWTDEEAIQWTTSAANLPVELSRSSPVAARRQLLQITERILKKMEDEALQQAEEAVRGRADIQNALAVQDFFDNAPAGTPLFVHNTATPLRSVGAVIDQLGEDFKFIELAALEDLDPVVDESKPDDTPPLPIDPLSEKIAQADERGIKVHLLGQIEPRRYEDVIQRLYDYPLLGGQPARDAIQVFIDRVFRKELDPNAVTGHSVLGAALGKRETLDNEFAVAEPMAGNRNSGSGAKGSLCNVQIVPVPDRAGGFRDEERKVLAQHGVNTARAWRGVGDVVIVTNRSLLEGQDSVYNFASAKRLLQAVSAVFHETVEHEILNSGRRVAPLEKAMGLMNQFLGRLKDQGWVDVGEVTVDYTELKVRIMVHFTPVTPTDYIVIEYIDEH